jgi:3-phenylpropionate/cinnamic acid dioxygenase small subunit
MASTPASAQQTVAQLVPWEVHRECEQFLVHEADLLDANRMWEWLALLTEDISYRMPIRITRERSKGPGFSETVGHFDDDYGVLRTRVQRLDSEYAWAEDPPSRTRRFVTNVRVGAGDSDGEYRVRSNLLVYRGRYDSADHHLISAERDDVLRRVDGRLKLARRVIYLDQTTVATHNLAILL